MYEDQLKYFEENWEHDFKWQEYPAIKPPKRGYYDILEEEDDGQLHLMSGYYSEKYDIWVVYPFWVIPNTLKFWSPVTIDPEEMNEDGVIIENIEDSKEKIKEFDYLDVKASVMSEEFYGEDKFNEAFDEYNEKYKDDADEFSTPFNRETMRIQEEIDELKFNDFIEEE